MAIVRLFRSRLARGVFALAVVVAVGITGYMVIEGWSLLDSAYMTILTFTTVGYEEVAPTLISGPNLYDIPYGNGCRGDAVCPDYCGQFGGRA